MSEDAFEIFWANYPRRVAKGNARKAFEKAIKKTTLCQMLKAIAEYQAHKPAWMDFKHPATWLNSEGWEDEWEPQRPNNLLSASNSILQRLERESEHERQKTISQSDSGDASFLPSTEWH
ncbi:hypothetical protein [Nitratireductor basaltis]|uniref:Uncharacterized protein n=1 Tax=Nitratireductor basaltis TaxID=472175 RepID=A0A084UDL4_9HYPH|nr:hypothetical protein [Nitratireductor basaltis]KFB11050.1 hypothetical protein EL18_02092 [Nitratireductor basaltis]